MNRSTIISVIGGGITASVVGLALYMDDRSDPSHEAATAIERHQRGAQIKAPATVGAPAIAPRIDSVAPAAQAVLPAPLPGRAKPPVPKFDIVRVNPRGDAVIAGRAAPNSTVSVSDHGKEIAVAKADKRGEWVVIPDKPLAPGDHKLSLTVQATPGKAGGEAPRKAVVSRNHVIVVVPKTGRDIAGRIAPKSAGVLALSVPSDGSAGTVVLQKPTPGPAVAAKMAPPVARAKPASTAPVELPKAGLRTAAKEPVAPAKIVASRRPPSLTLDAIDYDDKGNIAMSGRAPSGADIQVYLDNRPVGGAETTKSGVWRLTPSVNVDPGLYQMRVDQLNPSGKVVARIETPFSRAKPLGDLTSDAVMYVQPGNSLWRLARSTYGQGVRYTVIFEANRDQIRDPDLIYPGQIFRLPKVN